MRFPTPYIRKSLVKFYEEFNLTQEEIDEVDSVYETAFVFMQVIGSILLLIGVPGNLLVISVLRSKAMRRNMTALFLTYLAAFNLLNLMVGLTRYVVISFHGRDISLHSETLCLLHRNVIVFGHLATNWTILAVGMCKMAYVLVPDTLMKNVPRSFVHSVMLTMSTYGYAISYMFGIADIEPDLDTNFGLLKCEQQYLTLPALIQMSCTFLVPEVCMFFVNIRTIRSYYHLWNQVSQNEKKVVRVNYLMGIFLFISDIELLLAEIPYIIIKTFKPLIFTPNPRGAANYLLAFYVSVGLLYSNYALNCLTYCFFGGHFRRELRREFRPILSLFCDEGSRWVSSEASIDSELDITRCRSSTTARLSLNKLLDSDPNDLFSDTPEIFDAQTSMTLTLVEDGHIKGNRSDVLVADSALGNAKLSQGITLASVLNLKTTGVSDTRLNARALASMSSTMDVTDSASSQGQFRKQSHGPKRSPSHHVVITEDRVFSKRASLEYKSFKSK